ncbi:hypothetical protein [Paraferrimonas sedimenticola]|uniref:NIPSNAP protein n=1 Tax=Paraferrimonas sedimenticola TaxID=375674 RepID=A0AA37RT63_9GAMM|nr:hypothetical protein [Paraferrimonas sedimenticola]GLP95430.1 hypothetical protein GCM10007895_07360 [Paraferrimonas sedimenticola]
MNLRSPIKNLAWASLLALVSTFTFAKEESLARVYTMYVDYADQPAFEQAFKKHVKWRKDAGDPWTWNVYQVVDGKSIGAYLVRSGNHTWADLDAAEAFGPKASSNWRSGPSQYLKGVNMMMTSTWGDAVNWPEENFNPKFYQIVKYRVHIGKMQQMRDAAKDIHKAIVDTKWPMKYAFVQTESGGSGNTVRLVLPYETWTAMEAPEMKFMDMLTKAYGKEKAEAVLANWIGSIKSSTSYMLRARPDMTN